MYPEAELTPSGIVSADKPKGHVADSELAWAAGVFDHGGYIRPTSRTLRLRVPFPFWEVKARRFASALGIGRICPPYKTKGKPKGMVTWTYELTGSANIKGVVEMLRLYLTDPSYFDTLLATKGAPP